MSEPVDLDRLEALAAEATPGPWVRHTPDPATADEVGGIFTKTSSVIDACGEEGCGPILHKADAELIVALVNAAPALIAELRAAREVVGAVIAQAEHDIEEDGDGETVEEWFNPGLVAWTPCFDADRLRALKAALAAYRSVSEEAQDG